MVTVQKKARPGETDWFDLTNGEHLFEIVRQVPDYRGEIKWTR